MSRSLREPYHVEHCRQKKYYKRLASKAVRRYLDQNTDICNIRTKKVFDTWKITDYRIRIAFSDSEYYAKIRRK